MTENLPTGPHLTSVLDDLSGLIAQVKPDTYGNPTPCPEFDVAVLRSHILAWAQFFAAALEDPEGNGERIDVDTYQAPEDPAEAAALLAEVSRRIAARVEAGVGEQPITLFGAPMPGWMVMGMCLGEYLAHGNDLALGAGLSWEPPAAAVSTALAFMPMMLTDEYRGPDKSFGYPVEVPESTSDLGKLIAFTGRDPFWKAA